jgi:uncharacterized protein (PEP-CTERM system associated)
MSAHAASWTFAPTLGASEIYTDNLFLSPSHEQRDYVTEVSPGFALDGRGQRLTAALDYRFQTLSYLNHSEDNQQFHQLNGKATVELLPEALEVDADANIHQQSLSTVTLIPADNVNPIGDRINIYMYSVSPTYRHTFSGGADFAARYAFNRILYERRGLDSNIHQFDTSISSGQYAERIEWMARYTGLREERARAQDFARDLVSGRATYLLSPKFGLVGEGGYEHTNLASMFPTSTVRNGGYWAAGLSLRPTPSLEAIGMEGSHYNFASLSWRLSPRSSVLISWRDRDVGVDPGVLWFGQAKLQSRHSVWTAGYTQQTTTSPQAQRGTVFIDPSTGEVVLNPQPGQLVVPLDTFIPTEGIFVRKRADLSSELQGRWTTAAMIVYYEERDFLAADRYEKQIGGIGSVTLQFSPLTSLLMSGGYERIRMITLEQVWYGSIGPTRRIGRHSTLNLNYRYSQVMGHHPLGYRENRVMLQLEASL